MEIWGYTMLRQTYGHLLFGDSGIQEVAGSSQMQINAACHYSHPEFSINQSLLMRD